MRRAEGTEMHFPRKTLKFLRKQAAAALTAV